MDPKAHELELFVINDYGTYQRAMIPAVKNLVRKMAAGTLDESKLPALFAGVVEYGAKEYARQFGGGKKWSDLFPPAARREAAKELADQTLTEVKLNPHYYAEYVPKKYQTAWGKRSANPSKGKSSKKGATSSSKSSRADNPSRDTFLVLHCDAGHNRSGNPRRMYAVWKMLRPLDFTFCGCIEEGYAGRGVLKAIPGRVVELGHMAVTPGEVQASLKDHPFNPDHAGGGTGTKPKKGQRAYLVIQADPGNDRNGNPRRAYYVWLFSRNPLKADFKGALDIGYSGRRVLEQIPGAVYELGGFASTWGEVRETMKEHEFKGKG